MRRLHHRLPNKKRFDNRSTITVLLSISLSLFACSNQSPPTNPPTNIEAAANEHTYATTISWTSYGIPHVTANNWASLGYGYAYATAKDGLCEIAKDLITVRGERARFFDDKDVLASDVFHAAIVSNAKVADYQKAQNANAHAFNRGYVAGYNRYLQDHADTPSTCVGKPWLRPINESDLARLQIGVGIRYGLARFAKEIAGAAPPADVSAANNPMTLNKMWAQTQNQTQFDLPVGIGSNAIGMGKNVTASGRGLLFGNPHYPWHGPSRFHMIHTTIPGELDVMGVSLLNTNRVAIGFNKDVAWSHTVSTATRFTLYRLALNPANPMQYAFDGEYRDIQKIDVAVTGFDKVERPYSIYLTHFGPIVQSADLPWTAQVAFALRDAVIDNYQSSITYNAMNTAASVEELKAALHLQGVHWVNTIAADKHGNALYADISSTPNLSTDQLSDCQIKNDKLPSRIIMLDGTRSNCEWQEDPRAKVAGTMPAADMPSQITHDYVSNSNDSYWLSNPAKPLEGFSPIIGSERKARSLRTRAGLKYLEDIGSNGTKFTPQHIRNLLYSHRNYAAELLLDDILRLICTPTSTARGCSALAEWDRTMTVASRGGHLWREFWDQARHIEDLYAVPFDANNPIHTPTGIRNSPSVVQGLRQALEDAVTKLDAAGIALDARLGDIQYAARNDENIPVPGGEGWAGMFSMIRSKLDPERGYAPIVHGNSYIQVISWDNSGRVVPTGILTYSQSPEPTSPHYADQTRLYAQGAWVELPFYPEEIAADPNLTTLTLTE